MTCSPEEEIERLLTHWHDIIGHAAKADPLSRRYLLDTAPVRITETHLCVGYDPEFESEMARFDDARAKLALARAMERHLNRIVSVDFEPLKPDDRRPLPADHPVADAESDSGVELTGTAKWYANPIVKTVVEAFNGEITDIRE